MALHGLGFALRLKGDFDDAIANFTATITIDPKFVYAYINRGVAQQNKGDYDRAIADANEAIHLEPSMAGIYPNRGLAYEFKGDFEKAMGDYDKTLSMDPGNASAFVGKGIIYLFKGDYPAALLAMSRAAELEPKEAGIALFTSILAQRTGAIDPLPQAAEKLDPTEWPFPIVRLFLHQITPGMAMAAVDEPDTRKKATKLCEANFYIGEFFLRKGDRNEAARLLTLATKDCAKDTHERISAEGELRAIEAAR